MGVKTNKKKNKRKICTRDVLRRSLQLIKHEVNWTRGAAARTIGGTSVSEDDSDAFSFCSLGAIMRASSELFPRKGEWKQRDAFTLRAKNKLRTVLNGKSIIDFNDSRKHSEVTGAFHRATQSNKRSDHRKKR